MVDIPICSDKKPSILQQYTDLIKIILQITDQYADLDLAGSPEAGITWGDSPGTGEIKPQAGYRLILIKLIFNQIY